MRVVRKKTVSVKRLTKRELDLGRLLLGDTSDLPPLPETRGDCVNLPRPCPFVSCKHHLYLDVSARSGAIVLNFPDLEPGQLPPDGSCSLDVADRGGATLEDVGALMNWTRERSRQVEVKGLAKLSALRDVQSLREYVDEGAIGKRRLPLLPDGPDEDEREPEPGAQESIVSTAWRLDAIRKRLAQGEATLSEVRIAGRYANRAGARGALLELMRLGHAHRSASGIYREVRPPLRLVEDLNPPAEPVDTEETMQSMPDRILERLRSEPRVFSPEELREHVGSTSASSVRTQVETMMRAGLVVRMSPGQYVATEHAGAIAAAPATQSPRRPMLVSDLVAELRHIATQRNDKAERIHTFIAEIWPEVA